MRATFEQIIRAAQDHQPARALVPVATGGGKTRMAAGLLRRICDAGLMGKALFVCDRTELRDNGLGDFQAAFGTGAVPMFNDGSTLEGKLVLPDRVKAMSAHLFERILATGDGTPLQKTIVFCASDHHADLITNALNGLYSAWAKAHGHKRIQNYAFKCMSSVNGQALIPDFRGHAKSHIIATTKELLTTGVNVPRVRNIVFFRYVQSPLLFHQMIGRGTRIDRESGKLMFRIFDYTGHRPGLAHSTPPAHSQSHSQDRQAVREGRHGRPRNRPTVEHHRRSQRDRHASPGRSTG